MIEDVVRPAGPYRLHLMTYGRPFETPLPGGGLGQAWQRSDGHVVLRAPDEERLELLRFVLALDADTTEFGRRFRHDPLLGPSLRHLHGLRPLRTPTVARALLRAVCGQLIEARRARAIELAIVRACGEPAPTREAIGSLVAGAAPPARAGDRTRIDARPRLPHDRSRRPAGPADRGGRGAAPPRARAGAMVARSRRAAKGSAAGATGSSAISASSSCARRSAAAGSSCTRPRNCWSRTASGRGSRAPT